MIGEQDGLKKTPEKTASEPAEILHLPGERAGLREPNPEDPEEVQRFFEIEHSDEMVNDIVGSAAELEETLPDEQRWIRDMIARPSVTLKTIVADKVADQNSENKAEGWVRIDQGTPRERLDRPEEQERYERITRASLPAGELLPCEITVAMRPNGPEDLAASALFTACSLIESRDKESGNVKDGQPRRTIIVFEKPNSKDGKESRDALKRIGFVRKSEKVKYNDVPEEKADVCMYVLDWEKYDKRMNLKNTSLGKPSERSSKGFTPLETIKPQRDIQAARNVIASSK